MNIVGWVLVAAIIFTMAGIASGNSSAMTECQKTHSYDVCFQQLNR